MLTVTFSVRTSDGREYINIETHQSLMDDRLRASALGWKIVKIEPAPHPVYEQVVYHSLTSMR